METIIENVDYTEVKSSDIDKVNRIESDFEKRVNQLFEMECINASQDISSISAKDVQLGKLFIAIDIIARELVVNENDCLTDLLKNSIIQYYEMFDLLSADEIVKFIEMTF